MDPTYARFGPEELILRDELAIDRTLLAYERTLLAYLRAAVSLVIAGITIVHFATGWFIVVGWVCIPAGVLTGFFGSVRYRRMDKAIRLVRERSNHGTPPGAADHGSRPSGKDGDGQ